MVSNSGWLLGVVSLVKHGAELRVRLRPGKPPHHPFTSSLSGLLLEWSIARHCSSIELVHHAPLHDLEVVLLASLHVLDLVLLASLHVLELVLLAALHVLEFVHIAAMPVLELHDLHRAASHLLELLAIGVVRETRPERQEGRVIRPGILHASVGKSLVTRHSALNTQYG